MGPPPKRASLSAGRGWPHVTVEEPPGQGVQEAGCKACTSHTESSRSRMEGARDHRCKAEGQGLVLHSDLLKIMTFLLKPKTRKKSNEQQTMRTPSTSQMCCELTLIQGRFIQEWLFFFFMVKSIFKKDIIKYLLSTFLFVLIFPSFLGNPQTHSQFQRCTTCGEECSSRGCGEAGRHLDDLHSYLT